MPGEFATEVARAAGVMVFAAAGNDNKDVDTMFCQDIHEPITEFLGGVFGGSGFVIATVCPFEATWYFPCENNGVDCVGATNFADKGKAQDSNFGTDGGEGSVSYYATGTVLTSKDPDSQSLGNAYQEEFGTSVAGPFAAGIAALTRAAKGGSPGAVDACLAASFSGGPQGRFITADRAVACALGTLNVAPIVAITNPHDGDVFDPSTIVLRAIAGDCGGTAPPSLIFWSTNVEGALGQDIPSGNFPYTPTIPGLRTITAQASNSQGATGSASIKISIKPAPPDVRIVLPPKDGTTIFVDLPADFIAGVMTVGVGAGLRNCPGCTWTGSQGGATVFSGLLGTSIQPTFTAAGDANVEAALANAFGRGTAARTVTVVSDGQVHVKITQPVRDSSGIAEISDGLPVTLSAVAIPKTSQFTYTWLAGATPPSSGGTGAPPPQVVGMGASITWTPVFGVGNCESVDATVLVQVTDALGHMALDSIDVRVFGACSPP
jgi:hypothetical protein